MRTAGANKFPAKPSGLPNDPEGIVAWLHRRLIPEQWQELMGRRRGRPLYKLSGPGLIMLLIFHFSSWLNSDPFGERGGVNLYAAMGNEPVNLIDALGLECVGHTCKPGDGDDYDGLHFCGPPSPPPAPGPSDPPGFNRVPSYNPPDAGKPCCDKAANLKRGKRTDPPPTKGSKSGGVVDWTIHMALDLQIEGPSKDLQIYWTTCWRIDGTSGIIPSCSDKTGCDFPTVTDGNSGEPHVTTARTFWISCEGGKWTKIKHIAVGGYIFDGKWHFTSATN